MVGLLADARRSAAEGLRSFWVHITEGKRESLRLAEKLRLMTAKRAGKAGTGSISGKKPTLNEQFRFQNSISDNKIAERLGKREAKTPALPFNFRLLNRRFFDDSFQWGPKC